VVGCEVTVRNEIGGGVVPGGRGETTGDGPGVLGGVPRLIGGGVVPGGRGELPGGGGAGGVGGVPRLIGGGVVPGGRGELPGVGAGVLGGDPAWVRGRLPFEAFVDEVTC